MYRGVSESVADEALGIGRCDNWLNGDLVLGVVTDETLRGISFSFPNFTCSVFFSFNENRSGEVPEIA